MSQSTFTPPTNRNATISLVAAIFTVLTFCMGFAPIPFTALICYPVSAVLGILALVTGVKALRQIDQSAQAGRTLAWIGIWTGTLTILGVLCASTLTVLLLPHILDYVRQVWTQLQP
jgi:hypothetical protein